MSLGFKGLIREHLHTKLGLEQRVTSVLLLCYPNKDVRVIRTCVHVIRACKYYTPPSLVLTEP